MIRFSLKRSDKPNIIFVEYAKENDSETNMTKDYIVGKRYTYTYKGIKMSVKVVKTERRLDYSENGKFLVGFNDLDWVVKSLIKFGKIISPEEQRKIREKKLMSL